MKSFKYLLLLAIFFFSSYHVTAQRNKSHVDYISEKAYWEEYVKSTDRLKRSLEDLVLTTDVSIKVITTFNPQTGKGIKLFYKGGKIIGRIVGERLHNYHVFKVENRNNNRKSKKKKYRKKNHSYISSLSSTNYSRYQREVNDKVYYMSEKKYWKNYVLKYRLYSASKKKTRFSKKKVTMVKRTTAKRKKILLFYQNRRLIGKKVKGKFYNYLK